MKVEIRSKDSVYISGYVNAVERESRPLPRLGNHDKPFVERIRAGAFERALKSDKPIELRFNHDKVLMDTQSGLELYEDNIGLHAGALIKDPVVVQRALEGKLSGWSFGFICNKDSWDMDGEIERRTVEDLTLLEVSILDKTPAYIGTSVEARSDNIVETRGYDAVKIENNISKEPEQRTLPLSVVEKEIELFKLKN